MISIATDFLVDATAGWANASTEAVHGAELIGFVVVLVIAIRLVGDHLAYLNRQNRRVNDVLPTPDRTTVRRPVVDGAWECTPGHVRASADLQ